MRLNNRFHALKSKVATALQSGCKGAIFSLLLLASSLSASAKDAVKSLETPYTISKVRTAVINKQKVIVASSFEGVLLCIDYNGKILWENPLSGYYNHDVFCYDLDGDGNDEILVANANGTVYRVDEKGKVEWEFKRNDVPQYSVCAYKQNGKDIIACGGLDKNIYFLSPDKTLLQTIPSINYAITRGWADQKSTGRDGYQGSVNFLRPIKDSDGKDILALHGTVSSNNTNGALYLMDIDLSSKTPKIIKKYNKLGNDPIGSFSVHSEKGKRDRVLLGDTGMKYYFCDVNCESDQIKTFTFNVMRGKNGKNSMDETLFDFFGYRVTQVETIPDGDSFRYFVLCGSRIATLKPDFTYDADNDVVINKFSFNDMCKDSDNNIILGSSQSGGSSIHIINTSDKSWKKEMPKLVPPGKITQIINNSNTLRKELTKFKKPKWEREQLDVYFTSETLSNASVKRTISKYSNPHFLNGKWQPQVEERSWRDTMSSASYKKRIDKRRKYVLSSQQAIDALAPMYKGHDGASYWGGHGNDPYFYSPQTLINLFKKDGVKGKTTVLLYPELQDSSEEFKYVMNTLINPLAEFSQKAKKEDGTNLKLFIRTKNIFWHSAVYHEAWEPLISGKYSDVFIPALEETSSRTMEMSVAARLGIWSSGSVDNWGSRCARDNPSHDRLRQHSHQMLPNHFLRNMVYHISLGATYLDNFAVDQEYMSLLWELIGEGLLYVPKRDELVSISPVHLAMMKPDKDFLNEGTVGKWTIQYEEEEYKKHTPMVFDRMNVTWTAGVITPWDYSAYAAGLKDRRSHFLPSFPNGIVMLTPGETTSPYRKEMVNYMHPIYKNIMKSYSTDGKYYYVNGEKKSADTYYKTVEQDIKTLSKKLPITVEGEVAWVVAQTAPNHLRLTLIDGGYLNPSQKEAKVSFNTVKVKAITDLATGEVTKINGKSSTTITVPTGLFRFIDVEIDGKL